MRAVTALMIVCLSACGTSPALEQAWDEQDNRGGQQAQLDAQAIMVGMEQARIRAGATSEEGMGCRWIRIRLAAASSAGINHR
jgi:hypothetical protein